METVEEERSSGWVGEVGGFPGIALQIEELGNASFGIDDEFVVLGADGALQIAVPTEDGVVELRGLAVDQGREAGELDRTRRGDARQFARCGKRAVLINKRVDLLSFRDSGPDDDVGHADTVIVKILLAH